MTVDKKIQYLDFYPTDKNRIFDIVNDASKLTKIKIELSGNFEIFETEKQRLLLIPTMLKKSSKVLQGIFFFQIDR
jgi:hypothetical protein